MPHRHRYLEIAEFDNSLIVFDPRCKQVHLLTGISAVVFDACTGLRVGTLLDEFIDAGLDEDDAQHTIDVSLAELQGVGLVEIPANSENVPASDSDEPP